MQICRAALDIGILVRDPDAAITFYRDYLGLQQIEEMPLPGMGTLHRLVAGEAQIKLWQFDADPPPAGPTGMRGQAGIRYFSLTVNDLRGAIAELEAKGVKITTPVTERPGGKYIAMIEDPDGNAIELIEQT